MATEVGEICRSWSALTYDDAGIGGSSQEEGAASLVAV